jgi:hypothetical protein
MKRISRIVLAAALLAGGALFGAATTASAEDASYNGAPAVAPGATTVSADGTVSLSLSGFGARETVKIELYSDPVTLAAAAGPTDANGNLSASVKIPAGTAAGTHTIKATGNSTGRVAQVTITVTKASTSGNPSANTGALIGGSVNPWLPIGAGIVLVIGVAALSRRRAAQH